MAWYMAYMAWYIVYMAWYMVYISLCCRGRNPWGEKRLEMLIRNGKINFIKQLCVHTERERKRKRKGKRGGRGRDCRKQKVNFSVVLSCAAYPVCVCVCVCVCVLHCAIMRQRDKSLYNERGGGAVAGGNCLEKSYEREIAPSSLPPSRCLCC